MRHAHKFGHRDYVRHSSVLSMQTQRHYVLQCEQSGVTNLIAGICGDLLQHTQHIHAASDVMQV